MLAFYRLGDLYLTLDKDRPRVHFSEPGPMVLGRGGQRGDIYQLVSFVFLAYYNYSNNVNNLQFIYVDLSWLVG